MQKFDFRELILKEGNEGMFEDPTKLLELLILAILGVGGYKGVDYSINRWGKNGNQPQAPEGSAVGSIQVSPDCVTQGECERAQKTINDSIHDFRVEVKDDLTRQTQTLTVMSDKVSDKLSDLEKAIAGGEAVAIKASNHSVREHEQRFNHNRGGQ